MDKRTADNVHKAYVEEAKVLIIWERSTAYQICTVCGADRSPFQSVD